MEQLRPTPDSVEVTQQEYIDYKTSVVKELQRKAVAGSNDMSFHQMEQLISTIQHNKKLVGYAKSGLMKLYLIPKSYAKVQTKV